MKLFVSCLFPLLAASLAANAQAPSERSRAADAKKSQPSAGAGATATAPSSSGAFRRLDANGDGFLSEAELRAEEASRFNWLAIDRDGDGRISASEFTTAIPSRLPDPQQAGVSR